MTGADWSDFNKATACHICGKTLIVRNARDEFEFFHPETGEYCGKVHRYTRAPGSDSSCYGEFLKLTTRDENGKYKIGKWAKRQEKPEIEFPGLFCANVTEMQ